LLQGKILVERPDARIAEFQARAVNLAVRPRPRVPLWLGGRGPFALSSQNGAGRFGLFVGMAYLSKSELLRGRN
jgi:hypothetical protein